MVLGALDPLGKRYVDVLAEGLRTGRWCDRYETKGKRSGAFSSGSYDAPPYILMNYKKDVFADVYTLAHEAGHSMHSWFSQNSQLFQDRKSTRLNSSHRCISYAVFCLKKKIKNK